MDEDRLHTGYEEWRRREDGDGMEKWREDGERRGSRKMFRWMEREMERY